MTCVIGIDPGLSGGMAIYDISAKKLVEVRPLPVDVVQNGRYKDRVFNEHEFATMLADAVESHDVQLVVIEKVHSSPQMGVASAFKFGDNYGLVRMAATIYAPRVEYVTPQRWKARMMLGFDKKQSLAMARKMFGKEWFPKEKDEGLAEAALIAFYAAKDLDCMGMVAHPHFDEEEDPLS
jgi:crossover junction endodeoxyribonuclease RuvC